MPVDYAGVDAQALPLQDTSIDHVVSVLTLCTNSRRGGGAGRDPPRPASGGAFRFVEHGLSPEETVVSRAADIGCRWACAAVPLREGSWQFRGLVVPCHDGDRKWLPGAPHHAFDRPSESGREQEMRELSGIPGLETAFPAKVRTAHPARALVRLRSVISTCARRGQHGFGPAAG